ncbi:MAG: DUF1295 domain-containing protein [Lachnospiraceae bacterium]|nr:DUF1295 domain-containing protein [Lachnospiraceae bacterium]
MMTFLLIALGVALVCSCMGFKRFVWFLSIGYALAVAGIGVFSLVYGGINGMLTAGLIIGLIVLTLYGLRLAVFIFYRETKNAGYKKVLDKKVGKEPPVFVKVTVWILCGILYVCQTAGLHFRMMNGKADDACLYAGIAIMLIGAVIEALADIQKTAQKKAHPDMVANEGLFKMCRCPNYFGEILVWTGVTVSGINSLANVWQWIAVIFGYVCIVYVMYDGAKRLEKGHESRYGTKPEYRAYADHTPILVPLIPWYHINKIEK